MKRLLLSLLSLPLLLIGAISMPMTAHAACSNEGSFLGLPTWYQYLERSDDASGGCEITGPNNTDGKLNWALAASYVALAVVEILLRIASLVAVGYVIYGGIKYIMSQGDPEKAKTARQTIISALIGLVVAIAAAAIVRFLGNRLGSG